MNIFVRIAIMLRKLFFKLLTPSSFKAGIVATLFVLLLLQHAPPNHPFSNFIDSIDDRCLSSTENSKCDIYKDIKNTSSNVIRNDIKNDTIKAIPNEEQNTITKSVTRSESREISS